MTALRCREASNGVAADGVGTAFSPRRRDPAVACAGLAVAGRRVARDRRGSGVGSAGARWLRFRGVSARLGLSAQVPRVRPALGRAVGVRPVGGASWSARGRGGAALARRSAGGAAVGVVPALVRGRRGVRASAAGHAGHRLLVDDADGGGAARVGVGAVRDVGGPGAAGRHGSAGRCGPSLRLRRAVARSGARRVGPGGSGPAGDRAGSGSGLGGGSTGRARPARAAGAVGEPQRRAVPGVPGGVGGAVPEGVAGLRAEDSGAPGRGRDLHAGGDLVRLRVDAGSAAPRRPGCRVGCAVLGGQHVRAGHGAGVRAGGGRPAGSAGGAAAVAGASLVGGCAFEAGGAGGAAGVRAGPRAWSERLVGRAGPHRRGGLCGAGGPWRRGAHGGVPGLLEPARGGVGRRQAGRPWRAVPGL
jgi:hypothetical protein